MKDHDEHNRTVNLPCAFSEHFPVCPLPPSTNRLPFAIEAGEKKTPFTDVDKHQTSSG